MGAILRRVIPAAHTTSTSYAKGDGRKRQRGRIPGVPNKVGRELKELILEAAKDAGRNGRGKDGLKGYLVRLAVEEPRSFAGLLSRVLPLQISGTPGQPVEVRHVLSREEVVAQLEERGIPVPAQLIH